MLQNKEKLIDEITRLEESLTQPLAELLSGIGDVAEYAADLECELLGCIDCGCLIIALASSSPEVFFYPEPILQGASEEAALLAISEICLDFDVKERITDVSLDRLPTLLKELRHATVDRIGEGRFLVSVDTECSLLRQHPELMYGDIYLGEPTSNFAEEYKRLILDKDINRYTGYDLRRDMAEEDADFFVEEAVNEFSTGTAITHFVTVLDGDGNNLFIGEGVLYRFDGRGGAELSLRLLPEWQGRGYGGKLLEAYIKLAEELSLSRLYARIDKENIPSAKLLSKRMTLLSEKDGILTFVYSLD